EPAAGHRGGQHVRRRRDRQHVDGPHRHPDRDQDGPGPHRQPDQVVLRRVRQGEQGHEVGRPDGPGRQGDHEAGALGDLRGHREPGAPEPADRTRRGPGQARGRTPERQVGRSVERVEPLPKTLARAAVRRRPGPRRPWGAIALFVGPTLALYLAVVVYPILVTFYNSLHTLRMDLGMQYEYVGLAHFREILGSDEVFWKAAGNS